MKEVRTHRKKDDSVGMRGELLYRDGYISRLLRANSDDVLFSAPIITIYLLSIR